MDKSHSSGWVVARKLADCDEFHDFAIKRRLLAFATLNCEPASMQELIDHGYELMRPTTNRFNIENLIWQTPA